MFSLSTHNTTVSMSIRLQQFSAISHLSSVIIRKSLSNYLVTMCLALLRLEVHTFWILFRTRGTRTISCSEGSQVLIRRCNCLCIRNWCFSGNETSSVASPAPLTDLHWETLTLQYNRSFGHITFATLDAGNDMQMSCTRCTTTPFPKCISQVQHLRYRNSQSNVCTWPFLLILRLHPTPAQASEQTRQRCFCVTNLG